VKSLIYQCWTGPMRSGSLASKANMEEYAKRIGADYLFDKDPDVAVRICDVPIYYEPAIPWINLFDYDKVLIVDMDVFAVEGLTENIFDVPIGDVGICTEPMQPKLRAAMSGYICREKDERWAQLMKAAYGIDAPRDEDGLLKVYNSGMMVMSREGLRKAHDKFAPIKRYVELIQKGQLGKFYWLLQPYYHAMMVKHLDYTEMDNGWNSYIHYVGDPSAKPRPVNDTRTADTRFVHIQLRGADDYDAETLWRITNRPQSQWRKYD